MSALQDQPSSSESIHAGLVKIDGSDGKDGAFSK
jgi:hypothetical protein